MIMSMLGVSSQPAPAAAPAAPAPPAPPPVEAPLQAPMPPPLMPPQPGMVMDPNLMVQPGMQPMMVVQPGMMAPGMMAPGMMGPGMMGPGMVMDPNMMDPSTMHPSMMQQTAYMMPGFAMPIPHPMPPPDETSMLVAELERQKGMPWTMAHLEPLDEEARDAMLGAPAADAAPLDSSLTRRWGTRCHARSDTAACLS
jgi:hypothetical protein